MNPWSSKNSSGNFYTTEWYPHTNSDYITENGCVMGHFKLMHAITQIRIVTSYCPVTQPDLGNNLNMSRYTTRFRRISACPVTHPNFCGMSRYATRFLWCVPLRNKIFILCPVTHPKKITNRKQIFKLILKDGIN